MMETVYGYMETVYGCKQCIPDCRHVDMRDPGFPGFPLLHCAKHQEECQRMSPTTSAIVRKIRKRRCKKKRQIMIIL